MAGFPKPTRRSNVAVGGMADMDHLGVMALLTRSGRDDPARFCFGCALKHSFRNGLQQDVLCERLAQIGDAPGVHRFIARRLVVVRGHEDDGPLRS